MIRIDRLAFIGAGAMGGAMIRGAVASGLVPPDEIVVGEVISERRAELSRRHGVRAVRSNRAAVEGADVVILAVKPASMPPVLAELRGVLQTDQLALSVAAGLTLETLVEGLAHPTVVRAMPNTPAQVGAGVTVWTASRAVDATGRARASAVLAGMGRAIEVDDEAYLDMATAVSGSGPGYVLLFLEALIDAGVHIGLPRSIAHELAVETVVGSGLMARGDRAHPAELRNMVTSAGGTTAAGLAELEAGAVRAAVDRAVLAAYARSQALGRHDGAGKGR
jgi:pyrroline-5-carboxylate reductase